MICPIILTLLVVLTGYFTFKNIISRNNINGKLFWESIVEHSRTEPGVAITHEC